MRLLAGALLLLVPGCHLLVSHSPSTRDQRTPVDAGARDASPDTRKDVASVDAPRSVDAARPADLRAIDARRSDLPKVSADLAQPDLVPTVACSAVKVGGVAPKVVGQLLVSGGHALIGCEYPTGPITQCEAVQACKSPWKLCTPTAYAAAAGTAATPTGLAWSWLAGCVRKAGVAGLTQGACGSCDATPDTVTMTPLMLDCTTPTSLPYPPSLGGPGIPYPDAGVPLPKNIGLMSYYQNWCWYPPTPPGGPAGRWAPCAVNGQQPCVGGGNKTAQDPRRALCCYP